MIFSKKKTVVIADLYCNEEPSRIEADVVRYKDVIAEITSENLELKKGLSD